MKPPLCPSRMTKKKIRKITESNQVGQACFGLVNLYWLLLTTIMGLKKPSRRMCYTDLPRTEVRLTSLPFLPFWEISMTCFFFFFCMGTYKMHHSLPWLTGHGWKMTKRPQWCQCFWLHTTSQSHGFVDAQFKWSLTLTKTEKTASNPDSKLGIGAHKAWQQSLLIKKEARTAWNI